MYLSCFALIETSDSFMFVRACSLSVWTLSDDFQIYELKVDSYVLSFMTNCIY